MKFLKLVRRTVKENGLNEQEFVKREDLYIQDILKMEYCYEGTRTEVVLSGFFGLYEETLLRYYRVKVKGSSIMRFVLAFDKTTPAERILKLIQRRA